jgi:hypothetical protein
MPAKSVHTRGAASGAPSEAMLSEEKLIEYAESACDASHLAGEWIHRRDIALGADGRTVHVTELAADQFAVCRAKCTTIVSACNDAMGDQLLELAEQIYAARFKGPVDAAVQQKRSCKAVCSAKTTLPSDVVPAVHAQLHEDTPLKLQTDEERRMEALLADLREQGMGDMDLYDRSDMEGMREAGAFDGDADDVDVFDPNAPSAFTQERDDDHVEHEEL